MRLILTITTVLIFSVVGRAQSDFTRQLMASDHYEIRKATSVDKKQTREPASEDSPMVTPVEAQPKAQVQAPIVLEPLVVAAPAAAAAATVPSSVAIEAQRKDEAAPGVLEQVKGVFGENDETLNRYVEKVSPEDSRLNHIELTALIGAKSLRSDSNYSFRSYNSSYPMNGVSANLWFAPSFGFSGTMRASSGASIAGDSSTGSTDPVDDQQLEVGFRFRSHETLSRLSPSLEVDLLYLDDHFNVSADSVTHPRVHTSGYGFGLEARRPTSVEHAWIYGGKVFPSLHQVEGDTAVSVKSGDTSQNLRMSVDAASEHAFRRGQVFLFSAELGAEKNLYTGTANLPDLISGKIPSNVTVTSTFLNFSFGYRWGH